MTKEELEIEAEEYAFTHWADTDEKGDYLEDDVLIKEAYLASAKPREKRIAELEAQIEKMKCCGNCKGTCNSDDVARFCKDNEYKLWEIKEK